MFKPKIISKLVESLLKRRFSSGHEDHPVYDWRFDHKTNPHLTVEMAFFKKDERYVRARKS